MTRDPADAAVSPPVPVATAAPRADVLILASPRDAQLTKDVLTDGGISCRQCRDEAALLEELTPQAGSLLIAEEKLTRGLLRRLVAGLQAQPAWSDLPIVLVASATAEHLPLIAVSELGNVSLIQRPMTRDALLSTVASALRARRRQMEVRDLLQQQRDQAERKDQFLAMLAHELRNPLTPIRYAAHLLQQAGHSPERHAQLAQLVDRQVGHMGRIIDQLLDVSRLTRGLIRLEKQRLDLCALAHDTLAAHAIAAQAKQIVIGCECQGPTSVDGDATRLRQVLDNLIDNAIKFSPTGQRIQVTLHGQRGRVRLSVADHGDGIEKHLQPLLFDAFVQADRSLERSRGGLGLGLALVKGLVMMHGGEVTVSSEGPGSGSVFTVDLPGALTPADRSTPAESPLPQGAPRSILIAEDNVDAADALRMILESHGYHVNVVHSGPAAVQALASRRPDVLLCDIGLPGMSGYDVARTAPSVHRPGVMVALTGYGSADDKAHALSVGFDAHLAKPIAVPALLRLLAQEAG